MCATRPRSTVAISPSPTCGLMPSVAPAAATDRKSTRLNSSHGYISYAVFCLKKKKYQRLHQLPTADHQQVVSVLLLQRGNGLADVALEYRRLRPLQLPEYLRRRPVLRLCGK